MSLALDAPAPIGFGEKIWRINWGLVLVLTAIAGIGVLALYSAAGGRFEPWAARHAMRYGAAFGLMLVVALIHPKIWLTLAWPIYVVSMLLLVAVDVVGKIGMGAQRWLVIGPMQIQPSEIAKVAVILVLARYYHGLRKEEASKFLHPAAACRDPGARGAGHGAARPRHGDDGAAGRRALLFVAGVGSGCSWPPASPPSAACRSPGRSCTNTSASACSPSSIPTAIRWAPATTSPSPRSPSARAACSAKFLKGTQSSLNFLPEKQTDFIFTTFVEEWGMAGALVLLALFALVLVWGFSIALRSQHHFGRLVALGVTAMMFSTSSSTPPW